MEQERAYATILAILHAAKDALPDGIDGYINIHAYADGTVDGELIVKVPDSTRETAFDLAETMQAVGIGNKYWVSVGARYIILADEEIYRRHRGMNQVQSHYQRANTANVQEEFLLLMKEILPGMSRRYKREAYSIFIRIHWNKKNEKPVGR